MTSAVGSSLLYRMQQRMQPLTDTLYQLQFHSVPTRQRSFAVCSAYSASDSSMLEFVRYTNFVIIIIE